MPMNYIFKNWPADMSDEALQQSWKIDAAKREDFVNLLFRQWTSMALTEREGYLWERYQHLHEKGWYAEAKPYWDELVDRLDFRGLLRDADDIAKVERNLNNL